MAKGKAAGAAAGVAMMVAVAIAGPFEGETLHAIIPVKGDVPTICRGHTRGVYLGMTATKKQCDEWFAGDLTEDFAILERHIKVPMPATRWGALASWAHNFGETKVAASTLVKKLNAGDWRGACHELIWYDAAGNPHGWIHKGSKILAGLVTRRTVERDICLLEEESGWRVFLKKAMEAVGWASS